MTDFKAASYAIQWMREDEFGVSDLTGDLFITNRDNLCWERGKPHVERVLAIELGDALTLEHIELVMIHLCARAIVIHDPL